LPFVIVLRFFLHKAELASFAEFSATIVGLPKIE